MKKAILFTAALLLGQMFFAQPAGTTSMDEAQVYICTGPSSKKYHRKSTCKGLKNCSKEVKRVTMSEATGKGRTPCKWCYK